MFQAKNFLVFYVPQETIKIIFWLEQVPGVENIVGKDDT